MTKHVSSLVIFSLLLLGGCSPGGTTREAIVAGSKSIAGGPDFPHRAGSAGSTLGEHVLQTGSFVVALKDYRGSTVHELSEEAFLWSVFTEYGAFIRKQIDLDSIPHVIAKGGSSQPDPNSTRYEYAFVARDVSVIYDAEWFRGGPREPNHATPEAQVRYHIRVN